MKIISKFRDYYDSALAMGLDESIHYIRQTKDIDDKELLSSLEELFEYVPQIDHRWNSELEHFRLVYFFFCGKLYVAYKFTFNSLDQQQTVTNILYSISDIEKVLKKFKLRWGDEKTGSKWKRWTKSSIYAKRNFTRSNVKDIFEKYRKGILSDLNIKCNSPVLVAFREDGKIKLISNPRLADYNFVCLFDPYTAFQEISMFVGGVIGSQKVNIGGKKKKRKYDHSIVIPKDDKVAIERHGFDYKYSFRKAPEGKKVKRKRGK